MATTIVNRFIPCEWHDRYSYWRSLDRLWQNPTVGTIINVEHDMEYSTELARELEACPEPLCSHAYRMYLPREYFPHGYCYTEAAWQEGSDIAWTAEGHRHVDWSAIGFCKIAREARVKPLERAEWPGVETSVNRAVRGPQRGVEQALRDRWHIHWPGVEHYHRESRAAVN